MTEDLNPCPFCGGHNLATSHIGLRYYVFCHDCTGRGAAVGRDVKGCLTAEQNAIATWNTRATPPAPKVTEAQAEVVAKLITKWLGRSWEGLPEGRVTEKGFPVFSHSQRGWGFNGRKGDMIDLAREALTAAQEAAPKVTENPWASVQRGYDEWAAKPHNQKWVKRLEGTPIPNDLIVCIVTALTAAQEAGKP